MMSAHVQQASLLSGRSMTFMAVIGLHAIIISALLVIKVVPQLVEDDPVIVVVPVPPDVESPPPQPSLPRPADMRPVQTIPVINPPDVQFRDEMLVMEAGPPQELDAGPALLEPVSAAGTGPVIVAPPARAFTDLKYRAVMSPDEFYPDRSVTLQEEGVTIVNVCVGANGRIDGQPTVQSSSGHQRLDQAAIRWAREALRFTPATEDGAAVRACKGFRVVFNLN